MEEVVSPCLNDKQIDTIDVAAMENEDYGKRALVSCTEDLGKKEMCLNNRAEIESMVDLIGPLKHNSKVPPPQVS